VAARRKYQAGRKENAISGKSFVHGRGESYRGIVPAKQPNQGGRPSAEVAEGRPLTKENMPQSNPCQTPSWVSGPSGLERVRPAAPCASTPSTLPSEVRTVCVKRARTGLCGGQRVTAVPTATEPLIAVA
jgi:hypothetical protein